LARRSRDRKGGKLGRLHSVVLAAIAGVMVMLYAYVLPEHARRAGCWIALD